MRIIEVRLRNRSSTLIIHRTLVPTATSARVDTLERGVCRARVDLDRFNGGFNDTIDQVIIGRGGVVLRVDLLQRD